MPTTSGTASRGQDSASVTGLSSYINDSEGVFYVESAALANDGQYRIMSLSDGSTDNRVYIQYINLDNTLTAVVKSVDDTTRVYISKVLTDATQFHKIAFRYKANDFSLFINGVKTVGTPTNGGGVPSGLSRFGFDSGVGGSHFDAKVRDVRVYNTYLTDLELQTLTTI